MEKMCEKLVLNMFGGYTLTYGGKPITLGRGNLTKSVQLLQLLLLRITNGIAKDELVQALYDWEDVTDANNSLNSMIYRLKNQLVTAGMPKEDYISIKNGICRWIGSMPVEVDTVKFEACVEAAQTASGKEKRELLETAVNLYRGEFLPQLSNELWVTVESVRLKKLYVSCVHELCDLLEEKQEYQQMFNIFKMAAELYPFDEWQEKQIDALQKMERYDEAFKIYQDTVKLYSEELGAPPSQKMRELLQKMNGKLLNSENDLMKIQSRLREGEWRNGAYYCAYPSFVDVYRWTCRVIERSGQTVYLMECILCYEELGHKADKEAEQHLREAIERSLRRGDIYTRYSQSQYMVLLVAVQRENCEVIFERIERRFNELNTNKKCWIEYNVTEVVELAKRKAMEAQFKNNKKLW